MVGLGRFELPTSRLSGVRSNQLSYRPSRGTAPIPWKLNRDNPPIDLDVEFDLELYKKARSGFFP